MKTVSKKLLSLLLVAILLVSALPFQAFAAEIEGSPEGGSEITTIGDTVAGDPAAPADGDAGVPQEDPPAESKIPHAADHRLSGYETDGTNHYQRCLEPGCEKNGEIVVTEPHNFRPNGVCVCGVSCSHTNQGQANAVAATCVKPGKGADTVCLDCDKVIDEGKEIPATGIHNYVNGVCADCGAKEPSGSVVYTLTFKGMGGTIGGTTMTETTQKVEKGFNVGTLPTATRAGYAFDGWYIGNVKISDGYVPQADATVEAHWVQNVYQLTVRRVLNNNNSSAETILTVNVPAGTKLLDYLNLNVTAEVRGKEGLTPGYKWDGYWRDYSGNQLMIGQADTMNQAQTMFVNFVAQSYTLYFNPGNGATVSPTNKTVYFNSAVGNLPVPTASGKVFKGWKDANGTMYDAGTIYKVAGDTTLTAAWDNEATVVLYVYVNGNLNSCDRMLLIDKLVQNDNINRSRVFSEIANHYTATAGNVLSIAGLFDENTWASYKANTSKAGVENIQIDGSRVNKIYVMVKNANAGTILPPTNPTYPTVPSNGFWVRDLNGNLNWYPAGSSLPSGYGYWTYDANGNPIIWVMTGNYFPTYPNNSNPKTGDTAQIEMAAAVMVLAAAALITVMALRKKKHA